MTRQDNKREGKTRQDLKRNHPLLPQDNIKRYRQDKIRHARQENRASQEQHREERTERTGQTFQKVNNIKHETNTYKK